MLDNDSKTFTLILTDAGLPDQNSIIVNPIDTFSKKHPYSGDYLKDKRNFVSIRDGKNASELLFFTHFEKENGECTGELKGVARYNSAKTALFRANGNPCVLEFTFNGNTLNMKEIEACGSYRDIKCFFEGNYLRKKEYKPRRSNKKN